MMVAPWATDQAHRLRLRGSHGQMLSLERIGALTIRYGRQTFISHA